MIKSNIIETKLAEESALTNFSYDIIHYNQQAAHYYEDKKYKFLMISVGLMGFGASFLGAFKSEFLLVIAALILIAFALLSVISYTISISSIPQIEKKHRPSLRFSSYNVDLKKSIKQNYEQYRKKFMKIDKKEIIEDNISQIIALFYMHEAKKAVIKRMSHFLLLGLVGFFIFVLYYASQFLS